MPTKCRATVYHYCIEIVDKVTFLKVFNFQLLGFLQNCLQKLLLAYLGIRQVKICFNLLNCFLNFVGCLVRFTLLIVYRLWVRWLLRFLSFLKTFMHNLFHDGIFFLLHASGSRIRVVKIKSPTLHSVFIAFCIVKETWIYRWLVKSTYFFLCLCFQF